MAGPMDLVGPGVATDYRATGPIAGVLAAQQIQDAQDAQGRSFRDSDLAYQLKQHEYEQALANDPVAAAKRQLDLSTMGSEQKAWDNGTNEDIAAATRQQKLAAAIAGKSSEELKTIQAKANKFLAATNEMEPEETADAAAHARNKQLWDEKVYPELAANGMAKGIPKEYDPAITPKILKARSEAAIQTSDMIQKTRITELENKGKLDVAKTAAAASNYAADNAGVRAAQVQVGAAAKEDANTQMEKGILQKAQTTGQISSDEYGMLVQIQKEKYKADPNLSKVQDTLVSDWNVSKGDDTERKRLAKEAGVPEDASATVYAETRVNQLATEKAQREVKAKLGANVKIGGSSSVAVQSPASVPRPINQGGVGDVPPAPRAAGGKSVTQLTQEGWHWKQGSKGWGWYK